MKPRPLLEGAGFAALYTLPFAAAFLTPTLGDAYHHLQPFTTIAAAILLMIFLLTGLAALGFAAADRLPTRVRHWVWILPIVLLSWMLCRIIIVLFANRPEILRRVAVDLRYVPVAVAVFAVVALCAMPRLYARCVEITRWMYIVAAFGLLVTVPKLVYQTLRPVPRDRMSFERPNLPPAVAARPRIVWILMDELSYDQIFDHRLAGLALPHFDAFAAQSANFSAVQPVGYYTEEVIPSLLLGKPVEAMRKPYGGPVDFMLRGQDRWQRFDEHATIFADAQKLKWTTGVAGWYNPYCRLLPDVLDRCSWQFSEADPMDLSHLLSSSNSILVNLSALLPFRQRMGLLLKTPDGTEPHRRDYSDVMAQARRFAQDQRIRFVFVHLPVPHPPGIYDRNRQTLAGQGTYIDNLALADASLGLLLDDLQATPEASHTTIILSSDHSWRVPMWESNLDWTAEEQRISGGRFEPRPVLMVHLGGSDGGLIVRQPQSALVVHRILEALLQDQLHSLGDLAHLLAVEAVPGPAAGQK